MGQHPIHSQSMLAESFDMLHTRSPRTLRVEKKNNTFYRLDLVSRATFEKVLSNQSLWRSPNKGSDLPRILRLEKKKNTTLQWPTY